MRLDEIKAIARERGIRIGNMNKKELMDAILTSGKENDHQRKNRAKPCERTICRWYEEYQL